MNPARTCVSRMSRYITSMVASVTGSLCTTTPRRAASRML